MQGQGGMVDEGRRRRNPVVLLLGLKRRRNPVVLTPGFCSACGYTLCMCG